MDDVTIFVFNKKYLYAMKNIWYLGKYVCIQWNKSVFNHKYLHSMRNIFILTHENTIWRIGNQKSYSIYFLSFADVQFNCVMVSNKKSGL